MVPASLRDLLDKNVTRGEFLKYIGIALLALVGFYSILRSVSEVTNRTNIAAAPKNNSSTAFNNSVKRPVNSYGGSAYGG